MKKNKIHILLIFFVLLLSVNSFATKRYWRGTGATKNWNTTTNWAASSGGTTGSSVPAATDSVYFDSGGDSTCTINATVSIKYLNIASSYTHTISQGAFAITIGTSGTVLSGGTFSGGSLGITDNGIFTLSGTNFTSTSAILIIVGNYNFTSGTFTHNSGEVQFTTTSTLTGNTTFYKLTFAPATTATYTVASATTLTCSNELKTTGTSILNINTGKINAQGNITLTNTNTGGGGTDTIKINGTVDQKITGTTTSGQSRLPNIIINKSAGKLTLINTISVVGNFTATTPIDTVTGSTVAFMPGTRSVTGTFSLNNLTIDGTTASTNNINSTDTITFTGLLKTLGAGAIAINTGAIKAKGDITITNTFSTTTTGGTGTIVINGSSGQTITGAANINEGRLCNIKINKSGGTLTLKNYVNVGGDWKYIAGTIDASTFSSTVVFPSNAGRTISGKHTLYNVSFHGISGGSSISTISATDTLTVAGKLTTEGSNVITINTGVLKVLGDITINNTTGGTGNLGSATIRICGTSNQTITGASAIGVGTLCNVKIDKSSGTLILKNTVNVGGNWTYVQGTIDASTNTSTVCFPFSSGRTISGKCSLYNVSFYDNGASTNTISSGDTLTVLGTLTTDGTFSNIINTGTINLKGDLTVNNTSAATTAGGSATINVSGTSTQTITGASAIGVGPLCGIKINKTSGTLILKNVVNVGGNWIYSQGTIDASTNTSTVCFPFSSGRTISGTHSLYNVSFDGTAASTSTISSGDTLKVLGTLTTDGTLSNIINTGTIDLKGDLTVNNTNAATTGGGTATINISGTSTQTLTGASTSLLGRLCTIKINKPSGTLILKNFVNVAGNWIYSQGTIDASTNTSTVAFLNSAGRTISGKHSLYNILFYGESATTTTSAIASTDTLTALGELKFAGVFSVIINTGVINAKGDITSTNTASVAGGGSGYMHICGTGNQTFTGSGVSLGGPLCNVTIDKPSGTLTLASIISIQSTSHWKYIQGTVNPGSSTCTFLGGADINGGTMHFNNFRVQGGATATLSGLLNVDGSFYIESARTLNTNSYDVKVGGNWDNNGTFTYGTSKVTFNGSSSQYLLHPVAGQGFYNVEINKPSAKLYLNALNMVINHSLTLTKGIIVSNSTKIVSFIDNATCTGGSDSSYVSGRFAKVGNDAFTFALGDTVLSTGAYHPLTITAPSVVTDSYTASYRDSVQASGATLQTDSLSSISTCERWLLTRNVGTSTVVPTLGWNTNSCNVDGCHKLRVAAWDGTWWKSLGYNGITTSGAMGTVAAHSGFSAASLPLVIAQPINPSLSPTVTVSSNITICSTTSTNLTAAGATTYSWAPSTGLSSTTGTTVTATPPATTTYTVTGTNTIGCTGTATVTVTIITTPTVTVSPTSAVSGAGSPVSLTASGASTYTWLPTTSLSPTTGATVTATPTTTITYTVTGTATNGCTNTATSAITVEPVCITVGLVSGTACIQTPVSISASGDKACISLVNMNFGDSYSLTDTVDYSHPMVIPHTYSAVGSYTITVTISDLASHVLQIDTSNITLTSCAVNCDDCIPSFAPIPAKKYELSAWAKQSGAAATVTNYTAPKITVSSSYGSYSISFTPSGPIIDGWQKIDGEFTLPGLATDIKIKLESTSGDTYFDDIRVFPFDGSMKSYVYDPINMRLVAELDERNYATFYEYDEEGKLVRVKKETERGVMTIKENRNNTKK